MIRTRSPTSCGGGARSICAATSTRTWSSSSRTSRGRRPARSSATSSARPRRSGPRWRGRGPRTSHPGPCARTSHNVFRAVWSVLASWLRAGAVRSPLISASGPCSTPSIRRTPRGCSTPVAWPLVMSRPPGNALGDLLAVADGLLLTGGGDVDPASYGARLENADEPDPRADDWELALIAAARERALPTLGICRGAQLLAVAHGGRLAQRLSSGDGHRELGGMAPEAILAARHVVELVPGSRVQRALAGIGGEGRIAVNTIHHHEIADAGELEVTATAPGGVIEAVEPRSEWPCVGVQWHPEKMSEPAQLGLFAQLVSAARRPVRGTGVTPRGYTAPLSPDGRAGHRSAAAVALLGRLPDRRVPDRPRRGRRAAPGRARAGRGSGRGRRDLRRLAVVLGRHARARGSDPVPVPRVLPRRRCPISKASRSAGASTSGSTRTSRCTAAGSRAFRRSSARST